MMDRELGYEVTLVRDATASRTWEEMKAALEINLPHYAAATLSTDEFLHELPAQSIP